MGLAAGLVTSAERLRWDTSWEKGQVNAFRPNNNCKGPKCKVSAAGPPRWGWARTGVCMRGHTREDWGAEIAWWSICLCSISACPCDQQSQSCLLTGSVWQDLTGGWCQALLVQGRRKTTGPSLSFLKMTAPDDQNQQNLWTAETPTDALVSHGGSENKPYASK